MLPTIMYDTVKLVLPAYLVEGGITDAVVERIALMLQDLKSTYNRLTREERLEGKLEGFDVSVSSTRLIVENSFQKFVTGNQLTPMTAEDVKQGIEKLTELMGLPMDLAIINRLDVAINIPTEQRPAAYYACLGEMKGKYEREMKKNTNTLYYKQSKRKWIAFYDKKKEMEANAQKKGLPLPADLPKGHLLRMEFRILKDVEKQLKWAVTAATLYQPEFMQHMLNLLWERYHAIYKIRDFGGLEQVDGVKDYENYLLLDSIRRKGGPLVALKDMEQIRPFKRWDDQQYNRLRNKLIKIAETPRLTSVSPLVEELDRKVQELTFSTPINAPA